MITYDDVIAANPSVSQFNAEIVQHWVDIANLGFPDSRFKSNPDQGRMFYVLHMLEREPTDINAPHIRAQMGNPKPMGKKPLHWEGTTHGKLLMSLVRY